MQHETDERRPEGGHLSVRLSRLERIESAANLLREEHGDPRHHNRSNAVDELLLIVLSTMTQEANYLRTFRSLKRAFPTFRELEVASHEEITEAISTGGLSDRKAKAIRAIIDEVVARHGRLTLAPLSRMDDLECERFLTSLPIVGLKTARCVMMYSLGRSVFPVDTHCWRICKRLGWVRPRKSDGWCSPGEMDRLQRMIPASLRYSLHVNLVAHGRKVCRARVPRCHECVLANICPSCDRYQR